MNANDRKSYALESYALKVWASNKLLLVGRQVNSKR